MPPTASGELRLACQPEQAAYVVGEVGEADLGRRAGQADFRWTSTDQQRELGKRKTAQKAAFDQSIQVMLNAASDFGRPHEQTDLDVPSLSCFGQICRADERGSTTNHYAFRVEACAWAIATDECAWIVIQVGQARARPLALHQAGAESGEDAVLVGGISRPACDVDAQAHRKLLPLYHPFRQSSEDLATLVGPPARGGARTRRATESPPPSRPAPWIVVGSLHRDRA